MLENAEYRSSSWEAGKNEEVISGYAVVFDQRTVLFRDPLTGEEYGEQIDRHALDDANMKDVVLRYNHEGRVLARTRNNSLRLSVDVHGLRISADLSGSDEARSFYEEVKNGLLDKMSFAFTCNSDEWDPETRTRTVKKIGELCDVSIVDFPAYPQTEVSARSALKSQIEADRKAHFEERAQRASEMMDIKELRSGYEKLSEQLKKCQEDERKFIQLEADAMAKRIAKYDAEQERRALAEKMTATGTPLPNPFGERSRYFDYDERGNTMNSAESTRAFYSDLLEKRSAGTTGTMTSVIPRTIIDAYVKENSPGAFLDECSTLAIEHAGDLSLPIAKLVEVSEHEENAEIAENNYVPELLTIHHKEYAYNVAYSRIGIKLSLDSFMNAVNAVLMGSMMKKMDGICYDAVAGLDYTAANSVKVTSAPALADFVAAAGKLHTDYINKAKWYMNSNTYFNWLMGLTDSNKKPIFDPSKKLEDQALLGYPLAIDSQIPDNTIYFGDGSRVHLNYADSVRYILWTDHEHNTEKAGVTAAAGAAAEPGSFVKLSK